VGREADGSLLSHQCQQEFPLKPAGLLMSTRRASPSSFAPSRVDRVVFAESFVPPLVVYPPRVASCERVRSCRICPAARLCARVSRCIAGSFISRQQSHRCACRLVHVSSECFVLPASVCPSVLIVSCTRNLRAAIGLGACGFVLMSATVSSWACRAARLAQLVYSCPPGRSSLAG